MLSKGNTGLIVVDVQGKLATLMHESDALIENITKLVKGAKALDLPILWLEQNPERLGPTAEPIREVLESTHLPITKYTFDGCKEATFTSRWRTQKWISGWFAVLNPTFASIKPRFLCVSPVIALN